MSNRRRGLPQQDYGALFTPEQIAAIRKARQRAIDRTEDHHHPDGKTSTQQMNVRHTDKDGKPWVFSIDCTPFQREFVTSLLSAVNAIGGRAKLTAKYYEGFEENERFCRDLERAVLLGLSRVYPSAEPQNPPRILQPQPERITNDTDEPEEYEPTFYWENF